VVAGALAAASLVAIARPADALVICQRKKKVTLRSGTCKAKETLVGDLDAVSARGNDLKARGTQVDALMGELGFACAGDPTRKLVLSKFDTQVQDGSVTQERLGGGCRSLDGNQAACVASFQNGDPFDDRKDPQVTSCFFFRGKCLPCSPNVESRTGACTNTCFKVPSCADATRTVFAGGADQGACGNFGTQADCEKAWHVSDDVTATFIAASCFWDAVNTRCKGCGRTNAFAGKCTNSCAATPAPPTCKDATRVTFIGGPELEACTKYDADQTNCEKSYHIGGDGIAASCWFDTSSTNCHGCGLRNEINSKCTNTCL
jgi:hypothetical protein